MSTTFKPYTYLIGWSTLNKYYYGVQFNKKANPDDLWSKNFQFINWYAKKVS